MLSYLTFSPNSIETLNDKEFHPKPRFKVKLNNGTKEAKSGIRHRCFYNSLFSAILLEVEVGSTTCKKRKDQLIIIYDDVYLKK